MYIQKQTMPAAHLQTQYFTSPWCDSHHSIFPPPPGSHIKCIVTSVWTSSQSPGSA